MKLNKCTLVQNLTGNPKSASVGRSTNPSIVIELDLFSFGKSFGNSPTSVVVLCHNYAFTPIVKGTFEGDISMSRQRRCHHQHHQCDEAEHTFSHVFYHNVNKVS